MTAFFDVWRFTCHMQLFEVRSTANPIGLCVPAKVLRAKPLQHPQTLGVFECLHSPKSEGLSHFHYMPMASFRFWV